MKRENERGFALLLVFMLAAAIAISLYKAMPRAAFESERNKEELLIERGEQYTRAVQLFVTKFKRFPANMDELEKTNNIRFLRKKFVDPMTGKDEWRLLHVNALGILTDSKIKKKTRKDSAAANDFISLAPTLDQSAANNKRQPTWRCAGVLAIVADSRPAGCAWIRMHHRLLTIRTTPMRRQWGNFRGR